MLGTLPEGASSTRKAGETHSHFVKHTANHKQAKQDKKFDSTTTFYVCMPKFDRHPWDASCRRYDGVVHPSPTLKARFAIFVTLPDGRNSASEARAKSRAKASFLYLAQKVGTHALLPIVEAVFDQAIEHAVFLDHDKVPRVGLELERPREPVRGDGQTRRASRRPRVLPVGEPLKGFVIEYPVPNMSARQKKGVIDSPCRSVGWSMPWNIKGSLCWCLPLSQ